MLAASSATSVRMWYAVWLIVLRMLAASLATSCRMWYAVWLIVLRMLAASLATSCRMWYAVWLIVLRMLAASLATSVRIWYAVWLIVLRMLAASSATSSRMWYAVWLIVLRRSPATRVISSFVALLDFAAVLLLLFALAVVSLTMCDRSSFALLIVTVTLCGSLILSRQDSFVIRSSIVVPYSGSGTRHTVPSRSASRGSPVLSLSSSPVTVTVTTGSLCRRTRSIAHIRRLSTVSHP